MNKKLAFYAGVCGGVAVSILLPLIGLLGIKVNLEMLWGTLFGLPPGVGAWIFGLGIHLFVCGVIAQIYAFVFEYWWQASGLLTGMKFAIIHGLVGGVITRLLPRIHPLVPDVLPDFGPILSNFGLAGIVSYAALHMTYGATFGYVYDWGSKNRSGSAIHCKGGDTRSC